MADTATANTDHITPLDFHAPHPTLPNTHVWKKEEEEDCFFSEKLNCSIPVVDMGDPSATELIGTACEEWGAFQLTGHGIPMKLLQEVGVQSRRLFDLPTSQKLKALRSSSGGGRGMTGYGQPKISSFYPKQMWHEGFTIAGDVAEHAAALWPHDHLSFWYIYPVVDMEDPSAMEIMGKACQEWGAFQLTGHGVPVELLREIGVQSSRLFDLPLSQKLKAIRPSPFSSTGGGVSGFGQPRLSYLFPKQMWNEGFTIAGPFEDLAAELWPHDFLHFCNVIEEYKKEMTKLSEKLIIYLLQWLGVTREEMRAHCEKGGTVRGALENVLHLNSYPPCPEPDRAMGLMTHTDSTIFTVLHQVQTAPDGGLQLLHKGVGWVSVPPVTADSFVVNMGDLFDIISNGKFQTVRHRATVSKSERRFSFAYFYFPMDIYNLSPLPKLVENGVAPLYRDVTMKEFAKATTHDGDTLLHQELIIL